MAAATHSSSHFDSIKPAHGVVGTSNPVQNDCGFDHAEFDAILSGNQPNPKLVLGPQQVSIGGKMKTVVRTFAPDADAVWITDATGNVIQAMTLIEPEGLFEVVCDSESFDTHLGLHRFRLSVEGKIMTAADPYAFESLFSDLDLHLFGEGNHFEIYNFLGAQLRTIDGVSGINFAVWAPNAAGVSLIGSFNEWDGRVQPMSRIQGIGIWEVFIPDAKPGDQYKFRVTDKHGRQIDKSDPYGFYAELPPKTASVVADLEDFQWTDSQWLEDREKIQGLDKPISVYELHLGSWRTDDTKNNGWKSYRDLASEIVDYCKEMQFTHVQLMPVSEHPYTGSWGYQTVGYFSATSRYGSPQDLMHLVNHCHENGIGVFIDWVPAHFPKDGHGLNYFDGTALYEHADPRQGHHPDWDTSIFNYGRNEVRNFLVANALFWLDKFHIDGLRVDAVASMLYLDYSREEGQWIPNKYGGRENLDAIEFLKQFNEQTHERHPGTLTIAEESTAWGGVSRPTYAGGLGFSIKWNMGWMNDTLRYFRHEPIHRKYHHDELTFSLIYAFTENFALPLSHDEVVHGKGSLINQMPGDAWQKFANLRLLYAYMWTHPGKKLLFMGNEMAQWNEWDCNSSLQWELLEQENHRGVQKFVSDLNGLYQREPSLHQFDFSEEGFEWIESGAREDSVIGYLRKGKDASDSILVVCNFTPMVRQNYRIGVPTAGQYREVLNSDSHYYAGSNVGNMANLQSEAVESQGRENSILMTLPPLSAVILKPVVD